jgi:hypothetical protein
MVAEEVMTTRTDPGGGLNDALVRFRTLPEENAGVEGSTTGLPEPAEGIS